MGSIWLQYGLLIPYQNHICHCLHSVLILLYLTMGLLRIWHSFIDFPQYAWSPTGEALDYQTNSPHQHLMEYMGNNMENMHTDVRLKVFTICFVSIGDKKRRDVVQCIVQVPKYDFYIIASQKGIICQWSSKVFINTHSLLIFL